MNLSQLHKKLNTDRVKLTAAKIQKVSQKDIIKLGKSWFHLYQQDWGRFFVFQDQDYCQGDSYLLKSFAQKGRSCEAVVAEDR